MYKIVTKCSVPVSCFPPTRLTCLGPAMICLFWLLGAAQWRRQGGKGEASPLWVDVQKLCNMCAFIVMERLRITRQMHCTAVEQRARLIHRQYNWDWGTSYSRPHIDPYLTSPLLQNPGGAIGAATAVVACTVMFVWHSAVDWKRSSMGRTSGDLCQGCMGNCFPRRFSL